MIAVLVLLVVSSRVVSIFMNTSPVDTSNIINDLINVDLKDDDSIKNLSIIKGEARGYYYFEASFPVKLETLDGKILKTYIVQAKDNWMTEEYVPFDFVLDFTDIDETEANLVFEKSNPSGLPENDFRYSVRVKLLK